MTNVKRLARHGRLIVYGNIASWDPHLASTNDLLMNGQSLMTYNSNLLSQTQPGRLATSARAALALVAAGTITIEPTTEYPIEETSHALDQLAAGNTLGKSILRIAP
jgi:NADPH:quinone reductase